MLVGIIIVLTQTLFADGACTPAISIDIIFFAIATTVRMYCTVCYLSIALAVLCVPDPTCLGYEIGEFSCLSCFILVPIQRILGLGVALAGRVSFFKTCVAYGLREG